MPVACDFRDGKGNNEEISGQIGAADRPVARPLTAVFGDEIYVSCLENAINQVSKWRAR